MSIKENKAIKPFNYTCKFSRSKSIILIHKAALRRTLRDTFLSLCYFKDFPFPCQLSAYYKATICRLGVKNYNKLEYYSFKDQLKGS